MPDPQAFPIRLTVNGETKQDGSTGQMIFPVAAVIAFLSRFVTLEPGDLISTGTPSGVGSATGIYLKPGDEVVASIEGIGELSNPMDPRGLSVGETRLTMDSGLGRPSREMNAGARNSRGTSTEEEIEAKNRGNDRFAFLPSSPGT